jgi:hypothetical protein
MTLCSTRLRPKWQTLLDAAGDALQLIRERGPAVADSSWRMVPRSSHR